MIALEGLSSAIMSRALPDPRNSSKVGADPRLKKKKPRAAPAAQCKVF
jgi:hypothetical protein